MTNYVSAGQCQPDMAVTALLDELLLINTTAASQASTADSAVDNDIQQAQIIHSQAIDLVSNALKELKTGQPLKIDLFHKLADGMVDSVLNNRTALACLGRIRDKDNYLLQHSVNTAILMGIFAHSLQMDPMRMQQVIIGALLHDIGKLLIPDEILNKPSRLSEDEFTAMKRHVDFSRELLRKIPGLSELSINVAAQHHERLDGTGYPLGLTAAQISTEGKMCAIVDVYDAITADRVYHKGMPPLLALKQLLNWSGKHLDIELVHHFINMMGAYPASSLVLLNNGQLALVMETTDQHPHQPIIKVIYDTTSQQFTAPEIVDLSQKNLILKIEKAVNPALFNIQIADFLP